MPTAQANATRQDAHALLTTAAATILGFALNLIAARVLGPAGKGGLDLAGASAGLFTLVLGFSLNAGVARRVAASGHAPAGLTRALWSWALLAGLAVAGLLHTFPGPAVHAGLLPAESTGFWLVFIAASTAFGVAASALRGVAVGRGALIAANRMDLLVKFLLLAAYLAAALTAAAPAARTFALAALPALALLPVLLHLAQRGPVRPEPGALRAVVVATLPLHGANLLHFLNQRADVFFVQAWHGSAEVGIYSLAVSLAQTVLFLSSALAVPLLARVAATEAGPASRATAAACRQFVLLGVSSGLLLAAGARWIVPLVFGRDFSGSLLPLLVLLPGMISFGLTNLLVSYFAGVGQNRINLGVSALGLLLSAAGNLTLTRTFGAPGAALVSTLAYTGMATLSLSLFARRASLPIRDVVLPDRETLRSGARMLAHLRP